MRKWLFGANILLAFGLLMVIAWPVIAGGGVVGDGVKPFLSHIKKAKVNDAELLVNTLTKKEIRQGCKLLFNGVDLAGWHNFRATDINQAWKVEDNAICLTAKKGGDIVTNDAYDNYELVIDWKISEGGNSGIFYFVSEDTACNSIWQYGLECQVLDNERHKDGKLLSHRAGSLYDLIAAPQGVAKPVGEFNHAKIVVNKGKVKQYLNGTLTASFDMNAADFKALVAKSKFGAYPKCFGMVSKGKIGLQDHGDKVWYRNIKIRPL